ncbi:Asp23/Gls24 family envelope stress response protein [Kribbella antibiotica]|uniref:Asp23/Gls24 family envelope stress response protein n=1 Tax=Kribbella antibiotica TaxID=190195 RepID=A0A4R4Z0T6_9ACTN|nr:DUF6286 domain-containing protein [Kribbella antibiotica]TDD51508.1 Asp23/Gls24 family envelope stress response protein [Kribbella antibiotica]
MDGPVPGVSGPSAIAFGGDRGRLEIAQRAVERIVEITARRHPAVSRQSAVLRRGLPKARAVVAGQRVRVSLETAITWPHPLAETAADLREAITSAVEDLTGLGVDRADVTITTVDASQVEESSGEAVAEAVAAKPPVAGTAVVWFGIVGAFALILAGCVALREMAVASGLMDGTSWLSRGFGRTAELEPAGWMVPAGIGAAAVGLLLLVMAFKRRRRTHHAVNGSDGLVWVRSTDVARLATDSARHVDSVTDVAGRSKRKRLGLVVTTFGDPVRVSADVTAVVEERLRTITPVPRTRIAVREE